MGGGDEALRVRWKRLQKGYPARGIQLPEDIVNQVDGCMSRFFRQEGGLRQLHGDGGGALLPFGSELSGVSAVQRDVQVIPVGAVLGLSVPDVPVHGGAQPFIQVSFLRGAVSDGDLFLPSADIAVGQGDMGRQERQQMGAQVSQFRAVQGQLARVGVQLEFVPVPVLEQVIARFQRPAVAEQGQSVAWMPLAAQKVHIFPAGVRAGLHQGKVVIPHPYHGIAVRQVAALVFAGLSVDAEVRSVRRPQDAPDLPRKFSADAEGLFSVGDQRPGPGCARGLQAQQEANGLQQAGFSPGVVSQDDGPLLRNLPGEASVATEVH